MPQQTESRLLVGGIDANTAPFSLEKSAVLNAVNLKGIIRDGQTSGLLDQLKGTEIIPDVINALPYSPQDYVLLGKCVCEVNKNIFLFLFNAVTGGNIVRYVVGGSASLVTSDSVLIDGTLGFTADMFISCCATKDLLIWTDNVQNIRYYPYTKTYGFPLGISELALIQTPGIIPLTSSRAASTDSSTIQTTAVQFTYRFINDSGFTSVLAPYSLTSLPTRKSVIVSTPNAGKAITVTMSLFQKIPSNWKQVDIIAYFPATNGFYRIKSWYKGISSDETEVSNHNNNTSPLTLSGWTGSVFEILDTSYTVKQFENVPNLAKVVELADSRLFLGNIDEGYDTPVSAPAISYFTNSVNAALTTTTVYTPYIIVVEEKGTYDWWFAVIIRFGGKNYLLPKDCSIGTIHFEYISGGSKSLAVSSIGAWYRKVAGGIYNLPVSVSRENLIELKATDDPNVSAGDFASNSNDANARTNIVAEANSLNGFIAEDWATNQNCYLFPYSSGTGITPTVSVETTPLEFTVGGGGRAFVPGLAYGYGIQYYDNYLRKSGVQKLGDITIPNYDINSPSYIDKITFGLPVSTTSIPTYATGFSIVLSSAAGVSRFGQFYGGIIKALFKDSLGVITGRDPNDLLSVPVGVTIYGIGIPISPNFPYDYTAGDYVKYSAYNTSGSATILGVYAGMAVIQFTNDGFMHTLCDGFSNQINFNRTGTSTYETYPLSASRTQQKVFLELLSGVSYSRVLYEVANFGSIINGQFGVFSNTGNQLSDVFGDAFTAIRTSDSGGGTGLSMTPNDVTGNSFWVNDLGRIAPIDLIGEKELPTTIRWSNTAIPGASINGYASFDALDFKTVDATSGEINGLVLTTKGEQDGGQLLAICSRNTFTALVGQQELVDNSGNTGIGISANVIGDFNEVAGGWGCTSPRSITRYQHHIWWVDVFNRAVIEFNNAGAIAISDFKMSRLFAQLFDRISSAEEQYITCGVNALAHELLVSLPAFNPTVADSLNTVPTLPYPFDAYVNVPTTYGYNYDENKWQYRYESAAEFIRVGNDTFSWNNSSFYQEFITTDGLFYGEFRQCMVAVPFNQDYPVVKTPHSLRVIGDRAPDYAWVLQEGSGDQHVASTTQWESREGSWYAAIRKDRTSGGANNSTAWRAAGISGKPLKAGCVLVVLIWDANAAPINVSSISLIWDLSEGHPKT